MEKERHTIEVTIPMKGTIIRAEQTTEDMYASIDAVKDAIERQLEKYKGKLTSHKHAAKNFNIDFIEENQREEVDESDEIKIVRTKRFAMKPMFAEEACIQMELLGHDFFVFSNADTGEVNVVYKRKKKILMELLNQNSNWTSSRGNLDIWITGILFARKEPVYVL